MLGEFTRRDRTVPTIGDLPKKLGLLEIGVPLGALGLLFFLFSVLQLPYLFGGTTAVLNTPGLTYATYARSGFFELCVAAGLSLPILLGGRALLDRSTETRELAFRAIAGFVAALILVLLLSATHRMALYWSAYGASLDRVYATSFMAWIGTVTVWFGVTTLRGNHQKFAIGGIASAFAILGLLNATNPSWIVAESLVSRKDFDPAAECQYLKTLSRDATPVLVEALKNDPDQWARAGCDLARHLANGGYYQDEWHSWNLGRHRAYRAISRLASSDIEVELNSNYPEVENNNPPQD